MPTLSSDKCTRLIQPMKRLRLELYLRPWFSRSNLLLTYRGFYQRLGFTTTGCFCRSAAAPGVWGPAGRCQSNAENSGRFPFGYSPTRKCYNCFSKTCHANFAFPRWIYLILLRLAHLDTNLFGGRLGRVQNSYLFSFTKAIQRFL